MSDAKTTGYPMFPAMRYADANAAISWLTATFGFEIVANYPGPDGSVAHAVLRFHDGMVMLGSARDDGYPVEPPARRGGLTASIYAVVPEHEIEAHFARTRAAGARIRLALYDTDYGSREYSVFDPEGYLWSFGTYRP